VAAELDPRVTLTTFVPATLAQVEPMAGLRALSEVGGALLDFHREPSGAQGRRSSTSASPPGLHLWP
jgi:hypothetical protein